MRITWWRLVSLEWQVLRKQPSTWGVALLALFAALVCLWDGQARVSVREAALRARTGGTDSTFAVLRAGLDSAWQAAAPGVTPEEATNVFQLVGYGDIVALPVAPLAVLGSGSLDVHSAYPRVSIWSTHDELLAGLEFLNPILASGFRFDATFVVVYLLPLLIIAAGCSVVAGERELGTFALLGSQPVSAARVFAVRILCRALLIGACFAGAIAVGLLVLGVSAPSLSVAGWLGVTLAYLVFWTALTAMISARHETVAGAALSGISAWFVIALLIPSILHAVAARRHPIPSRAGLLVEQRSAQEWSERQRPALVAAYRQRQQGDSSGGESLGWIVSTFAADERVRPLGAAIQRARDARHDLMRRWSVLSPATAAEGALLEAAGTGEGRFRSYRAQLFAFLAAWRVRYTPLIESGRPITGRDIDERLRFVFREPPPDELHAQALGTALGLGVAGVAALAMGLRGGGSAARPRPLLSRGASRA